jgi:hypothetical protein
MSSSLRGARDFSVLQNILTSSGVHSAGLHWVPGAISPGVKWLGHGADLPPPLFHLVLRLRMCGTLPPPPLKPSWQVQGRFCVVCQYNEYGVNQVQCMGNL